MKAILYTLLFVDVADLAFKGRGVVKARLYTLFFGDVPLQGYYCDGTGTG